MSVFSLVQKSHFMAAAKNLDFDSEAAYKSVQQMVEYRKKKTPIPDGNHIIRLERKWYRSLLTQPDYSVYSDPYYLCDLWACWVLYSKESVKTLNRPKSAISKSVVDYFGRVNTVLDVGCGIGLTTAGLKEIFPRASVYGTNLPDTFQYDIAAEIADKMGFEMIAENELSTTLGKIDVLFASEYFEHITNPVEHAYDLIRCHRPRFVVTANGFNGDSIGHFNEYSHLGKRLSDKKMNRFFNKAMRGWGYKRVETKIWNNRPMVWERRGLGRR